MEVNLTSNFLNSSSSENTAQASKAANLVNTKKFEETVALSPPSSKDCIVFPYSESAGGSYSAADMNPEWIYGKITEAEIKTVLSSLQNAPRYSIGKIFIPYVIALSVIPTCFFVTIIFILSFIGFFTTLLILIIAGYIGFIVFMKFSKDKRELFVVREREFNQIFEKENNKFKNKGIYFSSGPMGAWVQMVIIGGWSSDI